MMLDASDLLVIESLIVAGTLLAFLARVRRPATLAGYLLADRSLPGWLAGISMSVTSIWSASPMLATGLLIWPAMVGGWLWWSGALSGLLTAAFFARLWRRSAVLTDVELVELRYGGRTAALLRAIRALYVALPLTLLALAWLTGLLATDLAPAIGLSPAGAAALLLGVAALWAVIGGLRGLAVAHVLVLISMLVAGLYSAWAALGGLGGMGALESGLAKAESHLGPWTAGISPPLPWPTMVAALCVTWWMASGLDSEPGGGGAAAQRLLATKTERASTMAQLWAVGLDFLVRPWPWILVSGVLVARGVEFGRGGNALFSLVASDLPTPFRGMVVGAMLLSFLGAAATMLLRASGYLVHDIVARFLHPAASAPQRVVAARLAVIALAGGAWYCTVHLADPWHAFRLLIGLGAGSGFVLILRWYWWRVTGRAELLTLAASFTTTIAVDIAWQDLGYPRSTEFALALLIPAFAGVVTTLVVTFFTPPESQAVLLRFYRQVRPGGPGWWPVAKWAGFKDDAISGQGRAWLLWIASTAAVLGATVTIGALFEAQYPLAAGAAAAALVAGTLAAVQFRREEDWRRDVDLHL